MTYWTLFFVFIGVCFFTAQMFRVLDAIERLGQRKHRSNAPSRRSTPHTLIQKTLSQAFQAFSFQSGDLDL